MKKFWKAFKDWFLGNQPEDAPVSVGGQAVMEGVMMQGPELTAIAVRQANGEIAYRTRKTVRPGDKYPVLKWPLIRGIVSFISSLVYGMKTLTESAELAGAAPEEPSKFEKKLAEIFKVKADDVMMGVAVVLAVVLAVGLFIALPALVESLVRRVIESNVLVKLIGGVLRITLFLLYVYLCSRLKEIKRVFQYHGAEHKSIFCFESGEELTPENVRKFSRFHPRCGTSFLVIVMIISIVVFLLLGNNTTNVFARLLSNLLLLPLVAGISYEILRGLGRAEDTAIVRALKWPGMMVQRITTAEPDDSMLEVAIASLKAALGQDPLPPKAQEVTGDEAEQAPEAACEAQPTQPREFEADDAEAVAE